MGGKQAWVYVVAQHTHYLVHAAMYIACSTHVQRTCMHSILLDDPDDTSKLAVKQPSG